jgi:tetratricopeptide (TPR) repeat protein
MKYILADGIFSKFLDKGDLEGMRASVVFAEEIQPGFGKRPEIQLTLRIDRVLKEGQLDAVAALLKASKAEDEKKGSRLLIHIPQLSKCHHMTGGPRANQILSLIEEWFPWNATSDVVLAAALLPKWEAEHRQNPQDTSRLNRLITACVNLGKIKKANAIADRLLAESKANKAMLAPALTAYQLLNNYEGMEKTFILVVALTPENEYMWIQLARLQNYLGKTKTCLESLQKALTANQKGPADIRKLILSEPSFKNLHQNPKFKELFPPKKDK